MDIVKFVLLYCDFMYCDFVWCFVINCCLLYIGMDWSRLISLILIFLLEIIIFRWLGKGNIVIVSINL